MEVARRVRSLAVLLAVLGAGCGSTNADPVSVAGGPRSGGSSEAVLFATPGLTTPDADVELPDGADLTTATNVAASSDQPGPTMLIAAPTPADSGAVPSPTSTAAATTASTEGLLAEAKKSVFHQFGDDVYTWDGDGRIVVNQVPVGDPALEQIRQAQGHTDGAIEDTPTSRRWVEECARHNAEEARRAPNAVYGAVAAQSVYSCLGGLAHLVELLARYWWTDDGVACVSNTVILVAHRGDAMPRPLAVCPSVGYHPAEARPSGWLAQRCAEIVAAHPNPRYPTDPDGAYQSGEPLPSCWTPMIGIIEAHAAESAEIGLADSPHDCFHAFLGYVWARQTGRESRPPSDLAVGCHYRAFEATP